MVGKAVGSADGSQVGEELDTVDDLETVGVMMLGRVGGLDVLLFAVDKSIHVIWMGKVESFILMKRNFFTEMIFRKLMSSKLPSLAV